jgi:hypothetical protein
MAFDVWSSSPTRHTKHLFSTTFPMSSVNTSLLLARRGLYMGRVLLEILALTLEYFVSTDIVGPPLLDTVPLNGPRDLGSSNALDNLFFGTNWSTDPPTRD